MYLVVDDVNGTIHKRINILVKKQSFILLKINCWYQAIPTLNKLGCKKKDITSDKS